MASNFLVMDRLRAFFSKSGIYQHETILQDQPSLDHISSSGAERNGLQSAILHSVQVNYFRRERYKDYDKMDEMGEISLALDIYADESCVVNPENGNIVQVTGTKSAVKREVEKLFQKTLMLDHQCRAIVRYLCKYGCAPFRIMIDENRKKVMGIRRLDIYNFTRIETTTGELVAFHYSDAETNKSYFLHPWEVVHFRLTNFEAKFHPYGKSVIEGGRKAFKQLILMENSAVIYRLCLRGDQLIWTPNGHKPIKDIKEGDIVYCFEEGQLKQTKVTHWKCNGKDKIYKITSLHREIYANATHPVLVEKSYANKQKQDTHARLEYVDVKDLIAKRNGIASHHRFLLPQVEHQGYINLAKPEVPTYARLKSPVIIESGNIYRGKKVGLKRETVDKFFNSDKWILQDSAELLCEMVEDETELEYRKGWVFNASFDICDEFELPENIDEEFARLFGFMIGDGYASRRESKNSTGVTSEVGIALGDNHQRNQEYIKLFSSYFGGSHGKDDRSNGDGKWSRNSKHLYDLFIMNGFIPGAENKRVPSWVYLSSRSVQEAFIDGYVAADIGEMKMSSPNSKTLSGRIECCNEMLTRDFKELFNRLGWTSGLVSDRERENGHEIEPGRVMKPTTSWCLYFTKKCQTDQEYTVKKGSRSSLSSEAILSIEEVEEDLVYDITVEDDVHNFIVNGVPTHNTRAPQKRKFIIPVGNLPSSQVPEYLRKIAAMFKNKRFYNPQTNSFDERYSPLTQEDDFFLPQRPDGTGPNIETLEGAHNLDQIEDIEYFLKKMVAPTKIPISRLGIGGKTAKEGDPKPVAQTSSEFAKNVGWVQQAVSVGLTKIALVDLALKGYSREDLGTFSVSLMVSSAMEELYRIETWQTRVNIMADLHDLGWFPKEWIISRFTDLSPDEIEDMIMRGEAEMGDEAVPEMGGGGVGGGGGGDLFDGGEAGEGEDEFGLSDPGLEGEDEGGGDLVDQLLGESTETQDLKLDNIEKAVKKQEKMSRLLSDLKKYKRNRNDSIFEALENSNELLGLPTSDVKISNDKIITEGLDEKNTKIELVVYTYEESDEGPKESRWGTMVEKTILESAMNATIKREQAILEEDRLNSIEFMNKLESKIRVTHSDVQECVNGG